VRLLYFAWLRQRVGTGEETVSPPVEVTTVAELVDWLKSRDGAHASAFQDMRAIRVAVNQEYVPFTHRLRPDDEVAFFPPVTGG